MQMASLTSIKGPLDPDDAVKSALNGPQVRCAMNSESLARLSAMSSPVFPVCAPDFCTGGAPDMPKSTRCNPVHHWICLNQPGGGTETRRNREIVQSQA